MHKRSIPQKTFAKIASPNPDPDTLALAARVAALPDDLERLILERVEGKFKLYPYVLREIKWCFRYPEYAGEMVRKYQGVKLGSEICEDMRKGTRIRASYFTAWGRAPISTSPPYNLDLFWTRRSYYYMKTADILGINRPGWKRQYKNLWYVSYGGYSTVKSSFVTGIKKWGNEDNICVGFEYNYCPKVIKIDVLQKLTVKSLKKICKDNSIKGLSNKNKSEIYHALMKL